MRGRSFIMLNHIWLGFDAPNIVFGNVWLVAAIWMALALVASLVSIRTGISVALIEIFIGVIAGNFLHLTASNEWINFLALLGSGVLTFLAGAEIDPRSLKTNLLASLLIGVLSFAVPFGIVWLFAPIRSRLAAASGANRRHRPFHHFRGGGLRGDDRRRVQRHRDGQNDSGGMFHY